MSILIKNLNLLKNETYVLHCNSNGKVVIISPQNNDEIWYSTFDAVEILKPHGRLIDANALMELAQNYISKSVDCNDIARFPTVIEAEE